MRCVRWITPAAFVAPSNTAIEAECFFGNVGCGSIREPALRNPDLPVAKNMPIGEHMRLQFRAGFFNATNTPNFALASAAGATFGTPNLRQSYSARGSIRNPVRTETGFLTISAGLIMKATTKSITRRNLFALGASAVGPALLPRRLYGAEINVDPQALCAQTRRLIEATEFLGAPFRMNDLNNLQAAMGRSIDRQTVTAIQKTLNPYVLLNVAINPESRVSVTKGPAAPELMQGGWSVFLVRVLNDAEITARLRVESPQVLPDSGQAPGSRITATGTVPPGASRPLQSITAAGVADRWIEMEMFEEAPLVPELSGLRLEYRIIQLYSRDAGKREARIAFDAGPATQDIGFRNSTPVVFTCQPASSVQFAIRDADGAPATCSLVITDSQGRVYPSRAKRLAPDFPFQKQIYRSNGESVLLPSGDYELEFARGPEYIAKRQSLKVSRSGYRGAELHLERWIDPSQFGWYAGDHHIHAAGCRHYNTPSEGVLPKDIAPQIRGEGLSFGEVLTWGPSWYYQKQFFSGHIHELSTKRSTLRYDVEVSGFPSSYWGHLVLLRLQNQDFPNATELEQWPTWNLPILQWAKSQGAVTGFAHTGHGLVVAGTDVPNYRIPPFNDNGANEFLIDVTHGAVDFLSAVDTPAPAELNIWYHALNCGFRVPVSGETDFPCLFERVGIGRSYVHFDAQPVGEPGYEGWVAGLKAGRSYVSDGRSHLLEMSIDGTHLGGQERDIRLQAPAMVRVSARIAAYLPEHPDAEGVAIRSKDWNSSPYWHIERARIGDSRSVLAELIVNGQPVASTRVVANGQPQAIAFETRIDRSSWIALRILPSSHSNPLYITVGGMPIRASEKSAQWCLDSIGAAWRSLGPRIAAKDQPSAKAAVEHAVSSFKAILAETRSATARL